ncbi:hypothetical protein AYO44_01540 [Planctomycetaceae bacterium SCGC AG-212-F19]|nr:hypothetical protein AYO44_01540 [Planctomycetaceae bacterium SCGC AG-212-F19]
MGKRKKRAKHTPGETRPRTPAARRITCREEGGTTRFEVPASVGNAGVPLVIALFGCAMLAVLTVAAATTEADWSQWLFIATFGVPIVGLLVYAINVASRRGSVVVHGDSLTVTQAVWFFRKHGTWRKEAIQRVDAVPSAARVNGEPVLELAVFTRDDRRFGAFAHHDGGELCWLAERLRAVLDMPTAADAAAGNDPNAAGYFVLTQFWTWRPGEVVHLVCPGAPFAAVVGGGVIFAFMGTVIGYFIGAQASKIVRPWHVAGAAALVGGTFGMLFVSGGLPKRRVVCDWRDQTLTIGTGSDEEGYRLANIEALVIANQVMDVMEDEERRSTYGAQLTARIGGADVLLLATDHWEEEAPTPMNELRPLAQRWADALSVPLRGGVQQPFRTPFRFVWRHALPPLKWLLLVELAAAAAGVAWRIVG